VPVRSFPDTGNRDILHEKKEKAPRAETASSRKKGRERRCISLKRASTFPAPASVSTSRAGQAAGFANWRCRSAGPRHSGTFPRFFSMTRIKERQKCGKKRKVVKEDVRTSGGLKDSVRELGNQPCSV
jgi:hypothetical protein